MKLTKKQLNNIIESTIKESGRRIFVGDTGSSLMSVSWSDLGNFLLDFSRLSPEKQEGLIDLMENDNVEIETVVLLADQIGGYNTEIDEAIERYLDHRNDGTW